MLRICLLVGIVANSAIVSADVILDVDSRISKITGLVVNGHEYTATMHYNILSWEEFIALPVTPFTFTTQSEAQAAVDAIQTAVQADSSIATISGTDDLSLPFKDLGVDFPATHYVEAITMMHSASTPYASFPADGTSVGRVSGRSNNDGWIAFSAVPEPNGGLLLFSCLTAGWFRKWTRKLDVPLRVKLAG